MTKTFDKSEDDLKSLQSGVGQVSHFSVYKMSWKLILYSISHNVNAFLIKRFANARARVF